MTPDWELGSVQKVTATVDWIQVFKPESGWGTLRLSFCKANKTYFLSATGEGLQELSIGESVDLEGRWMTHPKYGPQLKITHFARAIPNDARSILRWLEKLPFVGPVRAKQMLERWPGETLWEVLETDPSQLTVISGITSDIALQISEEYDMLRVDREAELKLMRWGWTAGYVKKLKKRFVGQANVYTLLDVVALLEANPYRAMEVDGIGFFFADRAAKAMGISKTDPRRVQAAWQDVLERLMQKGGSTWITAELCVEELQKLEINPDVASEGAPDGSDGSPPIVVQHAEGLLSLVRVQKQEQRFAAFILNLRDGIAPRGITVRSSWN